MSIAPGYQGYDSREAVERRRKVAEALMASSVRRPAQNVGEGIGQLGQAFFGYAAGMANDRQRKEGEARGNEAFQRVLAALGGGGAAAAAPAFSAQMPAPAAPQRAPEGPIETSPLDPIAASAQAAGIDPQAWARQVQVESGGNPNAVSPAGATGVAQIMPATARDPGYGVPDIFTLAQQMGRPVTGTGDAELQALLRDPEVNARFGAMYQRAMLDQHGGDPRLAAAAYNAGPGAVQRHGGVPPYAETQRYVENVAPALAGSPAVTQVAQAMPQGGAPVEMAATGVPQQGGSASRIAALMEAAGNDWLAPGQQAVVQALLQRELRDDPGALTEYQRQSLDLQRQRLAQEGRNAGRGEFGLSPVWGTGPDGQPALIQLGRDGTPTMPQLPEGFQIARDPIRIDAGTQTILLDPQTRQVIGAIPKDVAGEAAQTAIGRAEGERTGNAPQAVVQAQLMMDTIDSVLGDQNLGRATGWGSYVPIDIPGFNAETRSRVRQLQGQAFLAAYNQLRGGGQITEVEGAKAEAAMARLNTAQTEAEFRNALQELRATVMQAMERARARVPASGAPAETVPGRAPAAPAAPTVRRYNPATGQLE